MNADPKGPDRRSTVTVRIAGEEHVLRSSADPEYTRSCAAFLDERIREIRERSGLVEGHRAVILAALALTDRYFQARDDIDRLRLEAASRATNLARRIEEELGEEPGEGVDEGERASGSGGRTDVRGGDPPPAGG